MLNLSCSKYISERSSALLLLLHNMICVLAGLFLFYLNLMWCFCGMLLLLLGWC